MSNETIEVFPSWFLALETLSVVILLFITVLSLPLYIFELFIVFTNRKTVFQGQFYRLIFVGMIVDVVTAINIFTGQILPARNILISFYLQHENLIGTLFYTITYGGRCIQGATAMLLAFNRVCAVCYPILYRKLNGRKYLAIMQIIQVAGAIAAVSLLIPKKYEYLPQNDGYYSSFVDLNFRLKFYVLVAIMEVFFVFCIVFFNVAMIVAFRFKFNLNTLSRRSSRVILNNRILNEKQKKENSLTQMTFIVCFVEIVYFLFVLYTLQINQKINKRIFYFFYNILGVIYSTFSAWMLLIFSKPITTNFVQLVRIVKAPKTQPMASISNNASQDKRLSTFAIALARTPTPSPH